MLCPSLFLSLTIDFPVLIFTDVSSHCWIVFGQARATVMRATRNGVSPTTTANYVTVEKSRQCHTSSTLSIDQVWRRSTALTWSRWGCRRLADNTWLLAHANNNNTHNLVLFVTGRSADIQSGKSCVHVHNRDGTYQPEGVISTQ